MGEVQTTGREHDSIDTPPENAEVEETRTEDGKCGSISTSTENDEAEAGFYFPTGNRLPPPSGTGLPDRLGR